MQRKTVLGFTAALALATIVVGAPLATAEPRPDASTVGDDSGSEDLVAIGLTTSGNRLVSFGVDTPEQVSGIGFVRGLQGDSRLIGIDYRVQNGLLYGVGNAGGIYTLDESNAAASRCPS